MATASIDLSGVMNQAYDGIFTDATHRLDHMLKMAGFTSATFEVDGGGHTVWSPEDGFQRSVLPCADKFDRIKITGV